jgi:Trypsin
MSVNKVIRAPLWATLLAALVTAMVVTFFVFVQSGEAAPQAADEQPSAKTPKIIGGTEVPNGKYPFMMALIEKKMEPYSVNPYKLVCGGTLIDKDSVLTAGHCLLGPPDFKELYDPQALRVTVGRTVLSSNQGQVRGVKRLSVHPRFKELPLDPNDPYFVDERYDAGVIELSRPVKGIKPLELATSKQNYLERPGRSATVVGWGLQLAFPPGGDFPPQSRVQNHMREAQGAARLRL